MRAKLGTADWSKILGAAALVCGAVYFFSVKDYDRAYELVAAFFVAAGITGKGITAGTALDAIQADLENIRANPAQPGTPLSPYEKADRGKPIS